VNAVTVADLTAAAGAKPSVDLRRWHALILLCQPSSWSLLPSRHRETADDDVEMVALSLAGCPGAPYCGHLARVVAFGRRVRTSLARS
jgi:hypothetical protein